MAISLPFLLLMFKSLRPTKPWLDDPNVINFSSRLEAEPHAAVLGGSDKVEFGLFENDGIVVPHSSIQRALQIVQKARVLKGYKARIITFFLRAQLTITLVRE